MNFNYTPVLSPTQFEERYFLIEEQMQFNNHRGCTFFKAFDIITDKVVFIKIPNPNGIEIEIQDFTGDYTQLLFLTDPHLTQLLEVFQVKQDSNKAIDSILPFIVYDNIEGITLKSLSPKLNEAEIIDIIQQVKSGLDYIHSNGWVHRDIKADNILVLESEIGYKAKIIDIENMGHIGFIQKQIVGTPEFIPPEMSFKTHLHPAQDYWAFGCLIYESLFTEPPFGFRNTDLEGINSIKEYQDRINEPAIIKKIMKISNPILREKVRNSLVLNPLLRQI